METVEEVVNEYTSPPIPFDRLPEHYRQAMEEYLPYPLKASYRIGEVPMEVIASLVMKFAGDDVEWDANGTFEEYHKWYVSGCVADEMPDHPTHDRWPVILNSEEVLLDGWHRFHDYYRKGAKMVPVVWLE